LGRGVILNTMSDASGYVPPRRWRRYVLRLAGGLTAILTASVSGSAAAEHGLALQVPLLPLPSTSDPNAVSYAVPSSMPGDCSIDVTTPILRWIDSVPNDSILSFTPGACYRIEGTLELRSRRRLILEGNSATFRSFDAPTDPRALWRLFDSSAIELRDMAIVGSYTNGSVLDESIQHAHGVDLRGTSAELANVAISDVSGDCVYFGLGYGNALRRSSGSFHDSTCSSTGRNAVSVTAGDDIRVERVTTDRIGLTVFDVEPSVGPGWGSQRAVFTDNTIGSYHVYAFAIIGNAPVRNQEFTRNHFVGSELKFTTAQPGATYRPTGVIIRGNTS
jgi:hypothetical protein